MNSLEVMLMGIAFICFSGFFLVGQALGVVSQSVLAWGMVFGLLLCFLGLLGSDEETPETDGEDTPEEGGDDTSVRKDDDTSDHKDDDTADRADYSANRFPPM